MSAAEPALRPALDRQALVAALAEEAGFFGVAERLDVGLPRALTWLQVLWGAGESHLPIGLVHDLGHILLQGARVRFASGRDLARWPVDEQPERLAYEDAVLGQWLRDPSVDAAQLAIAGVAEANQAAAIAHAIGLALAEPLRAADLVDGNAATLRAVHGAVLEAVEDHEAVEDLDANDAEWRAFLREQRAIAINALPRGALFQPADVWELANFDAVPSESLRLALRQLHEVRDAVCAASPGLLSHVQRRAREVPVEATAADAFPAGGFDGISQRGRFENLVRTEIGYVDVDVLPGVADAFDVRYVLGELLYYTRDDSPLLDAQRTVTVRFEGIERMRDKHAQLPLQTAVLVQGLALALHRDLCAAFGRAAVTFNLRWVQSAVGVAAADEERSLLATSLATDVAHGRVTADVITPDAPAFGATIVFSKQAAPGRVPGRTTWVRVDGATWRVTRSDGHADHIDMRSRSQWRALVDGLLLAAVGGKR